MELSEPLSLALEVGNRLKKRRETVSVVEGTTGGLINVCLQCTPGASRFSVGGLNIYSAKAGKGLLPLEVRQKLGGRENYRSAETYVSSKKVFTENLSEYMFEKVKSTWVIAESGATDVKAFQNTPLSGIKSGFTSVSILGPTSDGKAIKTTTTLLHSTHSNRSENMLQFTTTALRELLRRMDNCENSKASL